MAWRHRASATSGFISPYCQRYEFLCICSLTIIVSTICVQKNPSCKHNCVELVYSVHVRHKHIYPNVIVTYLSPDLTWVMRKSHLPVIRRTAQLLDPMCFVNVSKPLRLYHRAYQ